MNGADPQVIGALIGVVIVAGVLMFRMSRARKSRPLKLEWLWVMPVYLAAISGVLLWQMPPHGREWLWLALAFAVGAALGWQRGRMMSITVDPETHALNQRASPAAMMFIMALVVVRLGMRQGLQAEAGALHLSAGFVTDVLVIFAAGLFSVQRLEMALRARRLLADARAGAAIVR